jgi:hypothetical protein
MSDEYHIDMNTTTKIDDKDLGVPMSASSANALNATTVALDINDQAFQHTLHFAFHLRLQVTRSSWRPIIFVCTGAA